MRGRWSFACRGVLCVMLLLPLWLSGCGWTGKMFGGGKSEETKAPDTAASQAKPSPESTIDFGQIPPAQVEYTPELDKMQLSKPEEPAPPTAPPPTEPGPPAQTPPVEAATPPAPAAGPEDAPPLPPVKGVVPLPPHEKKVKASDDGDIDYRSAAELQAAVQKANDAGQFLGYTEPFDAFPILPGNDTVSAAFIPVDYPDRKVFYHAFYVPNQPFHKRVYGYTVIDMRTNRDFGHFDGDGDGIFEQKTLEPKIILEEYVKTSSDAKP